MSDRAVALVTLYAVSLFAALALYGIVGVNKKIATYTIPRNARVIAHRTPDVNY